jgi:hypothetical protein
LLLAAAGLLIIIVQAPSVVAQLYRDGDSAIGIVLPQLSGHLPTGTTIDIGDHAWYEAWWFMRATAGLPDHRAIWEAAPYVFAVVGFGAVAWTARMALGIREGLYTLVCLLAVSNTMRGIVFEPGARVGLLLHLALLCIALMVVWERARNGTADRRLLLGIGIPLAIFTAAGATDQLTIYDAIVPFVLSAGVWWWRTGERAARTLTLFGVVVGLVSLGGGVLLSKWMHHEGVSAAYTVNNYQLLPTGDFGNSIGNFLNTWTGLAGGDFFGQPISRAVLPTVILGVLTLFGLAAATWLVWKTARSWWSERAERPVGAPLATGLDDGRRSLFLAFWGSTLVIVVLSDTLTTVWKAGSGRFLIGGWAAVAALAGAVARTRQGRILTIVLVAAFALVVGGQNVKDGVPANSTRTTYSSATVKQISNFVESHDARVGYAAFWLSSNLTLASDYRIRAFPIFRCSEIPGHFCSEPFGNISSWYVPRAHTNTFLLIGPINDADAPHAPATNFGTPIATAVFGQFTVRVYGHDLAYDLGYNS